MMTKVKLREAVARFVADPHRVISVPLFCEIAGISHDTFRDVFKFQSVPMTVPTQIRVERALEAVRRGEVVVKRHSSKKITIGYRKEAKPDIGRTMGLTFKGGRIQMKVGLKNLNDYTQPTFEEEIWRS